MRKHLPGWIAALLVILVYFASLLPYGAAPLISHPDERHYAYAGIRMVETGDWLIPHTPDNEIRLKKPILPYWFAVAGFKTLGVGAPGFRLFWIFAACVTLALTYALARILGAGEKQALLAMLLTGANPFFFRAGVQSIPDMPLTMFMLMAAVGFCRILASTETPPRYAAWVAWLGVALAILTKGILPFVFAGFAIAFTLLFARARLKDVLSPLPILASVALVLAWFVYAAQAHPTEFATQFFGDQVTDKVRFGPLLVARQMLGYFAAAVAALFALPLVLAVLWWKSVPRVPVSSWPPAIKLLAAWSVLVPVMFSLGPFVAGRYLLPVLPLLAVLTVLGFGALDPRGTVLGRASAWLLAVLVLGQIGLLGLGAAIEFQLAPVLESAVFAALASALVVWTGWNIRSPARAPFVLPFAVLLALSLTFLPIARLILPTIAEPIAEHLNALRDGDKRPAMVIGQTPEMYVRLLTGKSEPFTRIGKTFESDSAKSCEIGTDDAGFAKKLRERGFRVQSVRGGYHSKLRGFFDALRTGELAEARRKNASTVYFAACPSSGQAASPPS